MIHIFISLARQNSEIINNALKSNDISTIQKTAHKIKPSIDQMGIISLKDIVRKIEKYDPSVSTEDELEAWIVELTTTLNKIADELDENFSL